MLFYLWRLTCEAFFYVKMPVGLAYMKKK